MSTITTCGKWAAAIFLILASPAFLILAIPFACGIATDAFDVVGTPAALSLTAAVSLAALCWSRLRTRELAPSGDAAVKPIG